MREETAELGHGSDILPQPYQGAALAENTSFARLVSLACHDLRTPLATVNGFARTLGRLQDLGEPASDYVAMIESAAAQLAELLDELGVVARIEAGRYEPVLREVGTGELGQAAVDRLGADRVSLGGEGGAVRVDVDATARAVSSLARCALRHGGLEQVEVVARGSELRIAPVTPASAPVILGHELRDLGAAAGVRVIEALGGSVSLDGDTLVVRLPG